MTSIGRRCSKCCHQDTPFYQHAELGGCVWAVGGSFVPRLIFTRVRCSRTYRFSRITVPMSRPTTTASMSQKIGFDNETSFAWNPMTRQSRAWRGDNCTIRAHPTRRTVNLSADSVNNIYKMPPRQISGFLNRRQFTNTFTYMTHLHALLEMVLPYAWHMQEPT
jgi:hypothetical protein